ncbi:LOG family protein [Candidatus Woesearchaeota archaeon]|nr:LOG family protein [Candidatus Woesearchaeota archaeon]
MKIAICGASLPPFDKEILKKSHDIGKEIAINNDILRFGGCWGYPYEAAKGAFENKGKVIAISPGKDREEHATKYKFPTENITEFQFTGLGIPGRNIPLVAGSDAVIIISGQIGTLNEFTLAFHQKKIIGILEGSGGITGLIKEIVKICRKVGEEDKVVYSKEPPDLVKKLNNLNNG